MDDLIRPDCVIAGLRATSKSQFLAELAKQAAARSSASSEAILAGLASREKLGSTGLGKGFALPHARIGGLDRLFGMFVRLARPIDFESIDGEPVDLAFLLLIPAQAGSEHMTALACISRELRDEKKLRGLRELGSAPALYRALVDSAD